jgi:hypothetical protein
MIVLLQDSLDRRRKPGSSAKHPLRNHLSGWHPFYPKFRIDYNSNRESGRWVDGRDDSDVAAMGDAMLSAS